MAPIRAGGLDGAASPLYLNSDPRGELSAAEIAQMFTDVLVRSLEA